MSYQQWAARAEMITPDLTSYSTTVDEHGHEIVRPRPHYLFDTASVLNRDIMETLADLDLLNPDN